MGTLENSILKYILIKYPYKDELSASRVTKMIYLADWKSAIESSSQITKVKWYYNHYGPFVDDFIEIAHKDADITVTYQPTPLGGTKRLLTVSNNSKAASIDSNAKRIIDFVIEATKSKTYQEFIKLVYSTYPVVASEKYDELNLVSMAKKYNYMKNTEISQ